MPTTKRKTTRIPQDQDVPEAPERIGGGNGWRHPHSEAYRAEIHFGPQHVFPADRAQRGMGWLRDLPDPRDTTLDSLSPSRLTDKNRTLHQEVADPIRKYSAKTSELSPAVDLREHCSPIEDQENLGSCTAHACVGMVEYMERRASGLHIDASRLYLYKVTRKLLNWTGDTGAFLRTTMKALVLFGVPPERWWAYDIPTFDTEPDPFLYSFAANYKAIQYLRLDPPGASGEHVLANLQAAMAAGYVVMFGFSVFNSLDHRPDIPYPGPMDTVDGGHAVLAVGYDDNRPCRGCNETGALLIRNSWGHTWGDGGYGWLPYAYVRDGLASDFWTCFQLSWVETGAFGQGLQTGRSRGTRRTGSRR